MEGRGLDYLSRVREGFLTEARRYPDQLRIVDAAQDAIAVQRQLRQVVSQFLTARGYSMKDAE